MLQNQPGSTGGVQASTASTTSSQTPPQGGAPPPPPAGGQVSDEVFAQLVRGISGYMTQAAMGQQPQDTIGDFLDNLGQSYQISQGEGKGQWHLLVKFLWSKGTPRIFLG